MPRPFAWLAAAAGALITATAIAQAPAPPTPATQPVPEAVVLVTDLVKGIGDEALYGMTVIVHYSGWLYDPAAPDFRGRQFDSSRERGQPFSFPLGGGRVIMIAVLIEQQIREFLNWEFAAALCAVLLVATLAISAALNRTTRGETTWR